MPFLDSATVAPMPEEISLGPEGPGEFGLIQHDSVINDSKKNVDLEKQSVNSDSEEISESDNVVGSAAGSFEEKNDI